LKIKVIIQNTTQISKIHGKRKYLTSIQTKYPKFMETKINYPKDKPNIENSCKTKLIIPMKLQTS
jgi:hypothetical protein